MLILMSTYESTSKVACLSFNCNITKLQLHHYKFVITHIYVYVYTYIHEEMAEKYVYFRLP